MKPKIRYQLCALSLIFMLFSSCIVQLPPKKTVSYFDFTIYPDFYLSQSHSLDQKYTPLGLVASLATSGYVKDAKAADKVVVNGQDYYDSGWSSNKKLVSMTARDAMDLIYEKAKAMGANGIIGIKIDYISGGTIPYTYGYAASGMAIKY